MEFTLKSSVFRVVALALGVVGLAGTVLSYSIFWVAVALGAVFGLRGYLFDYFTGSRYAGGQVTGWALAVGAAFAAFYWSHEFVIEGQSQISVWPIVIQYAAVVLTCWAALMFGLPSRRNEP